MRQVLQGEEPALCSLRVQLAQLGLWALGQAGYLDQRAWRLLQGMEKTRFHANSFALARAGKKQDSGRTIYAL